TLNGAPNLGGGPMVNVNLEISGADSPINDAHGFDDDHAQARRLHTARMPEASPATQSMLLTMSLFDRLATPLFLVTGGSMVLWANASCRRFFAQSHQLTLQEDRARAGSPRQRAALQAFLEGRPERGRRLQPDVFVLER